METMTAIIIAAITASAGIWTFITKYYDNKHTDQKEASALLKELKELKSEISNTNEQVLKLSQDLDQISAELKKNNELTKSISRSELNRLCNKYLRIGYVPLIDHEAFICLGEDYIANKGNSSVKEKFEKCKNLPIKDGGVK